jgi:hypothetical protein
MASSDHKAMGNHTILSIIGLGKKIFWLISAVSFTAVLLGWLSPDATLEQVAENPPGVGGG